MRLRRKLGIAFFLVSSLVSVLLGISLYRFIEREMESELRVRLRDITDLGRRTIDRPTYERLLALVTGDLDAASVRRIEGSADYAAVSRSLNRIRDTESDLVRFVYVLVPTSDPNTARFVVDADVLTADPRDASISHFARAYDVSEIPALRHALLDCRAMLEHEFVDDPEFHVRSVSAYFPIGGSRGRCLGVLGVDITDAKMQAVLNRARKLAGTLSLAVTMLALIISASLATILTRPLMALNDTVKRFAAKDFDARTDITSTDEIGELGRNFNDMASSLQDHAEHLEDLVERRTRELHAEKQESERLLLNVLPEPIALRLKQSSGVIVDRFEDVTVLFADIVGFTSLSARTSPEELVSMLDGIFSAFDELAGAFGLEKIKTIGDAYMVVGGIPTPRADHAESVASMGIAMHRAIAEFSAKHGAELSVRIGMNSGPVVAGVIGKRKFIYDLWGDAVNTASRMESHGVPGRIHVTEATYERLRHAFTFESRGTMEIKGKGVMATYLLVAPIELPRAATA